MSPQLDYRSSPPPPFQQEGAHLAPFPPPQENGFPPPASPSFQPLADYPPDTPRFNASSPPLFRISEVCSPSGAQFTPLESSSPAPKEDSFRLCDLSEPGYKLDLQSGQLQIHLDLSSGDVLNLSALPEAEAGSPLPQPDSSFIQPTYYEMSSTVSSMDESESTQSIYPYFNGSGAASASAAGGAGNASSSPYNLSNRYSELYSPSLYSQYYQSGYPSWAGAQPSGIYSTYLFILTFLMPF